MSCWRFLWTGSRTLPELKAAARAAKSSVFDQSVRRPGLGRLLADPDESGEIECL